MSTNVGDKLFRIVSITFMLFFSLFAALPVALWIRNAMGMGLLRTSILLLPLAALYTIMGALILPVCEGLHRWAFMGKYEPLDRDLRILVGAIWPFALLLSLIVYPLVGIIKRIY